METHCVFCEVGIGFLYDHYLGKGHAVVKLVGAMHYKQEGRGFDSWWCHWNFSLT
jgi:hypothetical protein